MRARMALITLHIVLFIYVVVAAGQPCSGIYYINEATTGTISQPMDWDGVKTVPSNTDWCRWAICAPAGMTVRVEMNGFQAVLPTSNSMMDILNGNYSTYLGSDYRINGGSYYNDSYVVPPQNGVETSSGQCVTIRYWPVNDLPPGTGFWARYTAVPNHQCAAMLENFDTPMNSAVMQGVISNPIAFDNFTTYQDFEHCYWRFSVPAGRVVSYMITAVNTEYCTPGCDYVVLYDDYLGNTQITKQSGLASTLLYSSTGTNSSVFWYSDWGGNRKGFSLTWRQCTAIPNCRSVQCTNLTDQTCARCSTNYYPVGQTCVSGSTTSCSSSQYLSGSVCMARSTCMDGCGFCRAYAVDGCLLCNAGYTLVNGQCIACQKTGCISPTCDATGSVVSCSSCTGPEYAGAACDAVATTVTGAGTASTASTAATTDVGAIAGPNGGAASSSGGGVGVIAGAAAGGLVVLIIVIVIIVVVVKRRGSSAPAKRKDAQESQLESLNSARTVPMTDSMSSMGSRNTTNNKSVVGTASAASSPPPYTPPSYLGSSNMAASPMSYGNMSALALAGDSAKDETHNFTQTVPPTLPPRNNTPVAPSPAPRPTNNAHQSSMPTQQPTRLAGTQQPTRMGGGHQSSMPTAPVMPGDTEAQTQGYGNTRLLEDTGDTLPGPAVGSMKSFKGMPKNWGASAGAPPPSPKPSGPHDLTYVRGENPTVRIEQPSIVIASAGGNSTNVVTQVFESFSGQRFNFEFDPNTRIVPYDDLRIIGQLGSGGFGNVYRVTQKSTLTEMALKVFKNAESQMQVEQFVREAHILTNLHHPHCLTCYGVVINMGELGILTHYMAGGDLTRAAGSMTAAQKRKAVLGAAKGLAHLHSLGMVHADIKPSNILVDEHGEAKLADFGITDLTGTHGYTERYAAPEVLMGSPSDQRSDIYSLGLVLFEVLGERTPFSAVPRNEPRKKRDAYMSPGELPTTLDPRLVRMIKSCLDNVASNRPRIMDVALVLSEPAKPDRM